MIHVIGLADAMKVSLSNHNYTRYFKRRDIQDVDE